MKINWKVRFQNKVTLTAIVMAVVALVYQVLGIISVVPAVAESTIAEVAGMVINLLVLLGIVVDPTTEGAGDSQQALTYTEPK
ncbi:phage holin [Clostridium sp. AF15-17LB]|nr:phage holin [Clostridium sp. AF15-17LB]